jgi:hypothetical protein
LIFGLKSSLVFLQKSKSKENICFSFSKSQFSYGFTVIQGKLTDGFAEFDCPFPSILPKQYCLVQSRGTTLFYVMRISSRIKSFVVNMKYKI